MAKKLLIVDVAAMAAGFKLEVSKRGMPRLEPLPPLEFRAVDSVLPAVTCSVQASFRTASSPSRHGMVANGLYFRPLRRPMFWEQSSALVAGERIWEPFRRRGGKVAMLFWQQSLGERVDMLLSPAPIHRHHGGMIQDCYSRPAGLYGRLCERLGGPFKLQHYWGPLACAKSGQWIANATCELLQDRSLAPDLCLTYLPTLDYDLQRYGPASPKAQAARQAVSGQLQRLLNVTEDQGYEVLIFGDYAMADVAGPAVLPNLALAEAGLMATRPVAGMLYPDFHASRAFAMVDHEIAHVYVPEGQDLEPVRAVLSKLPGVGDVLDRQAQQAVGLDHPNSGELVLLAQPGRWLAYPWWQDARGGPEYASHVDIHSKPGFDPCELLVGWPPWRISQDTGKVRGSHGLVGPRRKVAYAATFPLPQRPANLIELAASVKQWLER